MLLTPQTYRTCSTDPTILPPAARPVSGSSQAWDGESPPSRGSINATCGNGTLDREKGWTSGMYGDPQQQRRYAAALREQGADVRLLADQLIARTEAIGWVGRAADSMRERVRERASHLRAVAARHDTAADTLERHVAEVDRLGEAIETRQRKAHVLITEARSRVEAIRHQNDDPRGPRVEPDPADLALLSLNVPPAGHRDWLAVEIPGL